MTTSQARQFQFQVLEIIRRFNKDGAPYDDLTKCLLNVASMVAITAGIKLDESIKIFETLYDVAMSENANDLVKN